MTVKEEWSAAEKSIVYLSKAQPNNKQGQPLRLFYAKLTTNDFLAGCCGFAVCSN
jgi:hypothetical protein